MVRVYLDWNIFSYLKKYKGYEEPYKSLNYHLTKNLDRLLIPYSSAHLTDLIASYRHSENGRLQTDLDLKYLRELSGNKCIVYDYQDQKTYPDVIDVEDYFKQLLQSEILFSNGFDGLFASFGNTDYDLLSKSFLASIERMPNVAHQQNIPALPTEFHAMNEVLRANNMLDGIRAVFHMMAKYNEDPKIYRGTRTATLEQLQLNFDYSKESDPLKTISQRLKQSVLNQTFEEFCNTTLSHQLGNKTASRFETFTNYYLMLDFFGYYRDKKFKNLLQDSFHAYYGAHCDFFITDDDNTYHKTKALYQHFNIETKVCKSHEFNSQFYGAVVLDSFYEKPLIDVISDVITRSFVTTLHDNNFNPVDIYKSSYLILDFFNRVQVTHHTDGRTIIYLFKKVTNYSTFLFFKEIASIVNRLSEEFKADDKSRFQYREDVENAEILEAKWPGREWHFGKWFVRLEIQKNSPFGLTLSFEPSLVNC